MENYVFNIFSLNEDEFNSKTILLGHDIECSLPIALKMAEIENSLGITATNFIQLHDDFYNALEKRTFEQLKKIETLGHQLALHFDAHFWDIKKRISLLNFWKLIRQLLAIIAQKNDLYLNLK